MTILRTSALVSLLVVCACGGPQRDADDTAYATRGLDATDRAVRPASDASSVEATPASPPDAGQRRPVALVGGRALTWSDLTPHLAERAGGPVLEELVVEHLLERACAQQGIAITPSDLEREERLLLETLDADNIATDIARQRQLLEAIRQRRGLGDAAFAGLLRRSAMSRKLVQDEVDLSEHALRRAYDLRFGPTYTARAIVVPTIQQAHRAQRELAEQPFATVATRLSTDASADRGGLLPPINPADLSWPAGIRRTVSTLQPRQTSDPVAVDTGYAILRLETVNRPAQEPPTFEAARAVVTRDARLEQERLLMARLARDLLAQADITVLDPTLAEAWRRRFTSAQP